MPSAGAVNIGAGNAADKGLLGVRPIRHCRMRGHLPGNVFVFCMLLVVVWLPSFVVLPSLDIWQLVINTLTTIITFMLGELHGNAW